MLPPGALPPRSLSAPSPDASAPDLPGIRPRPGFTFRSGQTAFIGKLAAAFRAGDLHHLGVFVPGHARRRDAGPRSPSGLSATVRFRTCGFPRVRERPPRLFVRLGDLVQAAAAREKNV